jgi:CheY-like chemotaxis protein
MDLGRLLLPDVPRGDLGWDLSRLLLAAVDRLRPESGDQDDWPWRRYEILTLRYIDGLSPEEAAARLACTRRHFYRQLRRALDDLAGFLWAELPNPAHTGGDVEPHEAPIPPREDDRLELLRREAAPLLQSRQSCSLAEVWQSVAAVLSPLLANSLTTVHTNLPDRLPEVGLSPQVLKQFLLALIGDLPRTQQAGTITVAAQAQDGEIALIIVIQRTTPATREAGLDADGTSTGVGERASAQLAAMHGARLTVEAGSGRDVYRVSLPAVGMRSVLVVEDNEEVGLLFQRYLASGGYQPVITTNGREAIALAKSRELYAVTLDLMMSNEDGWDVLQALRHDSQTQHLPIIVCTVLDHEELAIMLGANAFLKKPIMREQLLQALAQLKRG